MTLSSFRKWSRSYFMDIVLLFLLSLSCTVQAKEFVVAGYLPDYRAYINVNASAPHLTDLILFSIPPHVSLSSAASCCLGEDHYRIAQQAKAYKMERGYGSLRLWVSVGGGGRSEAFSTIARSKESRNKFLKDLVELCNIHDLQGVDFDWEVPRTQADQQLYSELLVEATKILGKADILVSVALHARQFMPQRVYDEMDRVHFMAYDLDRSHVADYERVIQEIDRFTQSGCPASKMVLGIPAYGRHFQSPGLVKTFSELMDDSKDAAVSRKVWNGYQYETPSTIQQKVEYAVFKRMKGVFFWELGQDKQHADLGPGGILLESAAKSAKKAYGDNGCDEL